MRLGVIRVHMDEVHDMVERYKELIMEVEVKKYLQSHAFVPGEEFSNHPYVHDKAMAVAQEMRTMSGYASSKSSGMCISRALT